MSGKIRNPLMRLIPVKYRMSIRKFFRLKRNKGSNRYCVICESKLKEFLPVYFDNPDINSPYITRENARCPVCGSIERYRLIYIYLKNKTNIFDPPLKKVLHTAPELLLTEKLSINKNIDYISSDINPRKTGAMLRIDLTDIKISDNTFDVIISSHVLEHIVNDKKALSELFRVLKPGGWAMIIVPIIAEKTFMIPDLENEKDRFKFYGKEDHVRGYGLDFKELLQNIGFVVSVVNYTEELNDKEIQYLGLLKDDLIYYCKK
jgi:predicted SAM-dependent methyltransferase